MQIPIFEPSSSEPLLIIGLGIVLAFVGAIVMKRAGVPQILGFMLAGLFLGSFGILNDEVREAMFPVVDLALGLIGYNIGLEIRKDVFSGKTRQMGTILIFESILTFVVVSFLTNLVLHNILIAIVFGALASATDPASTVMVIWEKNTKGNLTETLMFVLALDDVVAILLANISISFVALTYSGATTFIEAILSTLLNLGVSSIFGAVFGAVLVFSIDRERERRDLLEFELGLIILLIGCMIWLHLSAILACMVFGFVVGNYVNKQKEPICYTLKIVMSPVVMLFFVIVGGSINFSQAFNITVLVLAFLYVGGRSIAKYVGAYTGARLTKAPELTSKYLGYCLMSQAGIAVGLSLVVENSFGAGGAAEAGLLILNVVIMTTMILQIIGPIAASEGLRRAGEFPIICIEDSIEVPSSSQVDKCGS
ncbi:MAG: cation:proton antiporter [Candidatus Thorarchaeota archaeon]|nr:cation:proton antiporter [Candidatus Thorarchaeota archaeon]